MEDEKSDQTSSEQEINKVPNPTGKGGFQDHPELINRGGKQIIIETFGYWFNNFKDMTIEELEQWQKDWPKSKRKVVADLALRRVINAKDDLREFREVADRTEGKAMQPIEHSGNMDINIKKLEEIIDELVKDESPAKH